MLVANALYERRTRRLHLGGIIGADFQKFWLELLVLADVNRMHGVGQPKLFECDGSLAAVGRGPSIEIITAGVPVL